MKKKKVTDLFFEENNGEQMGNIPMNCLQRFDDGKMLHRRHFTNSLFGVRLPHLISDFFKLSSD